MRIIDKIRDLSLAFFGSRFTKRRQFIGDPNLLDEQHLIARDEAPDAINQHLIKCANLTDTELYQEFGAAAHGLTAQQVIKKRHKYGLNQIEEHHGLSWYKHLWLCYKNPFNLLLTVLDVFFIVTDDVRGTVVITLMIFISTVLRFVQERRSNKAADKLKAMVSTTATVLRINADAAATIAASEQEINNGISSKQINRVELPIRELVPGDIVLLSAGDLIPADIRILTAKDLFVSQSALTGESLPVEKFIALRQPEITQALDADNIGFMGTNVISGSATAIILATGKNTIFGALAHRVIKSDDSRTTSFQIGINKVSWLLIYFMLVMSPIVFILNGITKHDWMSAAMFAMSIAVGLTPEMLPMIITSTLAKGAVAMSRRKVVVKRLDAIQNFGAMDILCTDKTGTLTQDKICLERHTDIMGHDFDDVLEYAYLNSYYQTGLKNLLDVAVLERANFGDIPELVKRYRKVDEVPFDFKRRRMSVVVARSDMDYHEHTLICKGAVEELISCCSHAFHNNQLLPLSPELLEKLKKVTAVLNSDGLRVVAVAIKKYTDVQHSYHVDDEADLTLVGYIAFMDPPKETTKPAIAALKQHGVTVKILTGDNELVTAKICRDVGLSVEGMLLGSQIDAFSDQELAVIAEDTTVFAKLTPAHKERIVSVLKSQGHTVGFMGDGINDAAALRIADIGISVDSAVDIAKEAADIILLEKSLMVLEEGVEEGRKTFANMLKYIKITASSNFGNVFSMLVASAFLPFQPMLPMHILVLNLLYDISQVVIPFDNVDKEFIAKPQSWNPKELKRFIIFFGPISSIFDITTFILLWHFYGASSISHATFFQSGWFIESLFTQMLIVHMIRTRKIPFVQSCASPPMIIMMLVILSIGVLLPMISVTATYFKMQALPLSYFAWLFVTVSCYLWLTQTLKNVYAKKYGWH
jgi:Mg2+-importing ATPase